MSCRAILTRLALCGGLLLVYCVWLIWKSYSIGFLWMDLLLLCITLAPSAIVIGAVVVCAASLVVRLPPKRFIMAWALVVLLLAPIWVMLIAFSASVMTRIALWLEVEGIANNSILMIEASFGWTLFARLGTALVAIAIGLAALRRTSRLPSEDAG